jgi:hypothetical protein
MKMDARNDRATPSSSSAVPLSVTDLENICKLLSLAAERGAFHIEEFEDVGSLHRRISLFLGPVAPGA